MRNRKCIKMKATKPKNRIRPEIKKLSDQYLRAFTQLIKENEVQLMEMVLDDKRLIDKMLYYKIKEK